MANYYTTKKFYICFDGGMDCQIDGEIGYNTREEAQKAIDELNAINLKNLGFTIDYNIENIFEDDPYLKRRE